MQRTQVLKAEVGTTPVGREAHGGHAPDRRVSGFSELMTALRVVGLKQLLKLRRGYQTGWDDMFRGATGFRVTQALVRVGFIETLRAERSVNVQAFARERDLDAQILEALCETMQALGLFETAGQGTYSLTSRGRDVMDVMAGWFDVSYGYEEIFESLEQMLKRERVYGRDFYRRSDYVARGSGEMEGWLYFPLAHDIIRRHRYERILDLGCGDGTFLRYLCQMNPGIEAFGIDVAREAIDEGRLRARQVGLETRLHLFAEDISRIETPPAPLRNLHAAFTFFVLHELLHDGEARVLDFLRGFRRTFPGVPLIVFEVDRPSAEAMRRRPGISIFYFLYHDLSQQKPVERDRWIALFRAAGFSHIEERSLGFARSTIYTLR